MNIDEFLNSPLTLITICQDVISALEVKRRGPGLDEKEEQLKEISRTIEKLEKIGVAVPEQLRSLKSKLIADLAIREEINRYFTTLFNGFEGILKDLSSRIDRPNHEAKDSKIPTKRSKQPTTNRLILQSEMINALKVFGGSAHIDQVLLEMKKNLNDKLTKRDLERRNGGDVVWENNTKWERLHMVHTGVLKNDSPRGIWELNKEYS
jgi:hypothetical protein